MRRALAALLGLALAGCADLVQRDAGPGPVPAAHAARVGAFEHWRLAGRVAVQRADQGFTADVDWRQNGQQFDLRVMAPLNGGTFRLSGDDGEVALTTPDGETHHAPDAATLMHAHLGWSLPLRGARYWIRGLPAPDGVFAQALGDERGRWTDFEQDRWRVSILDYVEFEGLDLPRRLFLARDELKVRFVIKQWERR